MIPLKLFDARLRVDGTPAMLADVTELWAPFVNGNPAPSEPIVVVTPDAAPLDLQHDGWPTFSNLVEMRRLRVADIGTLAAALNAIALSSVPDLAIHAAVVSANRSVIALPGTSGAGKSTLAAACLRQGMGYISDEALCLPYDGGDVLAYPRPLGLSPWSAHAIGLRSEIDTATSVAFEHIVAPSLLGDINYRPGPLSAVIVPERDSHCDLSLTPLHRAAAAATLLKLSFNHFKRPRDSFQCVVTALRDVEAWRLRYSNATSAAALLAQRFG